MSSKSSVDPLILGVSCCILVTVIVCSVLLYYYYFRKVDCVMNDWVGGECIMKPGKTCGDDGKKTFKRTVKTKEENGGQTCGDLIKTETCSIPCSPGNTPSTPSTPSTPLPGNIDVVKGWQSGFENSDSKVSGPEQCRQLALNSNGKYVAWGYRTDSHPDSNLKNTCFLYKQGFLPYSGNSSDNGNLTGCLREGEKVEWGCKTSLPSVDRGGSCYTSKQCDTSNGLYCRVGDRRCLSDDDCTYNNFLDLTSRDCSRLDFPIPDLSGNKKISSMYNLKFLNNSNNFDDTGGVFTLEKVPNEHSTYLIKKSNGMYLILSSGNSIIEWGACDVNSPQYQNGQCKWEIFPTDTSYNEYTLRNRLQSLDRRYLIQTSNNYIGGTWDKCSSADDQFKNGQCKFRLFNV